MVLVKFCRVADRDKIRKSLPRRTRQILDFAIMRVTSNKGQLILKRNRRDPNVIFGYRTSLRPQPILDFSVAAGGLLVAHQHDTVGREIINAGQIPLFSARFVCSKKQLAKCDTGNEDLILLGELVFDRRIVREVR